VGGKRGEERGEGKVKGRDYRRARRGGKGRELAHPKILAWRPYD